MQKQNTIEAEFETKKSNTLPHQKSKIFLNDLFSAYIEIFRYLLLCLTHFSLVSHFCTP